MHEFARVRVKDAEKKGTKVLEKHGLAVPVAVSFVKLLDRKGLRKWPCLKFSAWAKYLLDTGRLTRQLCACADIESMTILLSEFWQRYESLHPSHKIFEMQRRNQIDLRFLIPVYSHTDDGRSYKKQGFWVLNTHGALGRGTRGWLMKGKDKVPLKRSGMGLNFVGHTWGNHFLYSCMLRKIFKRQPAALDNLVQSYAEDMEFLLHTGVSTADGKITIRFCHLGNKGDLPALARMGNMLHTFSNCPRAASSKKLCQGICWMCLAGREPDIPFEDVSGQPLWESTLGQQHCWNETPAILTGVPLDESEHWSFFKTDCWHNLQLGLAKHWIASAFVSLLENLPLTGSMDDKIAWLDQSYKDWYRRKRISPHVDEIGREILSWPQASACPTGTWHKGTVSTHFMKFLEDLCDEHAADCARDPLLQAIVAWRC